MCSKRRQYDIPRTARHLVPISNFPFIFVSCAHHSCTIARTLFSPHSKQTPFFVACDFLSCSTLITFRNSCQLFTYRIRVFATWSTRNARRRSRSERENPSTFVPWSVVLHICSALCMKITFNFKYPKVPSIHYSPFVISKIMKRRNLLLKVQRHAAGCRFCSQQSSLVAHRFWQSVLCC